jgi:hypothetical protein
MIDCHNGWSHDFESSSHLPQLFEAWLLPVGAMSSERLGDGPPPRSAAFEIVGRISFSDGPVPSFRSLKSLIPV